MYTVKLYRDSKAWAAGDHFASFSTTCKEMFDKHCLAWEMMGYGMEISGLNSAINTLKNIER